MNRDVLQGKWKELRGRARQRWGELTDNDLDKVNGQRDQLVGLLQQKYGYTRSRAEVEIDQFSKDMGIK